MMFKDFDQVAKWYADTHPIRGKRLSQDIRPISDRKRSQERIEKVDDNCYMLHDGWGAWRLPDPANRNVRGSYYFEMAPIVWERREDGEYVRIRNSLKSCAFISRYRFLKYNMPEGLNFQWGDKDHKSGRHYVHAHTASGTVEKFFLPKFEIKTVQNNNQQLEKDSGEMLWFKRDGVGKWLRVGEPMPEPKSRLNKELCAVFKPHIDDLYRWMGAIIPALGYMDDDAIVVYSKVLRKPYSPQWGFELTDRYTDPMFLRQVIVDTEHPARVALAVCVAQSLGIYRLRHIRNDADTAWVPITYLDLPKTVEEAKPLRTKYLRVIRKALALNEIVFK